MEEDGGGPKWTRSRRERSDVSGGAARSHQQREDALSNAAVQNFSTEIFRVAKLIDLWPRAVYEHQN